MAPRKKQTNELAEYDDQLAELAKLYQNSESELAGGTNKLSLEGGVFSYQGETIKGDSLNVVVLSTAIEHAYYADEYDPEKISSPECYAIKLSTTDNSPGAMKPSPNCRNAVSESCATCEFNQYGTSTKGSGKGKACGQKRRLAIVLEDDVKDLGKTEVAFMNVPITSGKAWSQYVKEVTGIYKIPPFAAITQIKIVRDPKVQFRLEFSFVKAIKDKKSIATILSNRDQYDKEVLYEFPTNEEETESPKKETKKTATRRKTPAKKKTPARTRRR